jgi:hypothetical protein
LFGIGLSNKIKRQGGDVFCKMVEASSEWVVVAREMSLSNDLHRENKSK